MGIGKVVYPAYNTADIIYTFLLLDSGLMFDAS